MFFQLNSTIKVNKVAKIMQSAYLCIIFHVEHKKLTFVEVFTDLRTADAFPVVASLPPKKKKKRKIFGGREATTGNASAVRRLGFNLIPNS